MINRLEKFNTTKKYKKRILLQCTLRRYGIWFEVNKSSSLYTHRHIQLDLLEKHSKIEGAKKDLHTKKRK